MIKIEFQSIGDYDELENQEYESPNLIRICLYTLVINLFYVGWLRNQNELFTLQRAGGFSLSLMYYLKKFGDGFVINQVKNLKLPLFEPSPIVRNRLIFSGRVQKVGFRLEIYELAKRLNLTGWVKNRNDKKVEAELQGGNVKILFLIKYLKSLKRASVSDVAIQKMPMADDETNFTVIKNPCKIAENSK